MMPMITVCEWNAWHGYLAQHIAGKQECISLRVAEPPSALVERIVEQAPTPSLVLFHVNLSYPERLPIERERVVKLLGERGYTVWNGRVCDITKPNIQRWNRQLRLPDTCAPQLGDPHERVIVKNALNAHARPEKNLTASEREALGYAPYQRSPIYDRPEYPVMTRAEVPAQWWADDALYIERYINNVAGRFARIYLSGEACIISTGRSDLPVRRLIDARDRFDIAFKRALAGESQQHLKLPDVLARAFSAVHRMAVAASLDFGCMDLVFDDDDTAYIVDVNVTPFWGSVDQTDFFEHLRAGARPALAGVEVSRAYP